MIVIFHLQYLIVISFRGNLSLRENRSGTFCFPKSRHFETFAMKGYRNADPQLQTVGLRIDVIDRQNHSKTKKAKQQTDMLVCHELDKQQRLVYGSAFNMFLLSAVLREKKRLMKGFYSRVSHQFCDDFFPNSFAIISQYRQN